MAIQHTIDASLVLQFGKILITDEFAGDGSHVFVIRWNTKRATMPADDWIEQAADFFNTEARAFKSKHNAKPAFDGLSASLALKRIPSNEEWARYLLDVFKPNLQPKQL